MSNVVAIVEQAAEIFVSGARLMIPSLFWQTPRAAEVFGGILYRANPFLPRIRCKRIYPM
jgi:hypothetical protein